MQVDKNFSMYKYNFQSIVQHFKTSVQFLSTIRPKIRLLIYHIHIPNFTRVFSPFFFHFLVHIPSSLHFITVIMFSVLSFSFFKVSIPNFSLKMEEKVNFHKLLQSFYIFTKICCVFVDYFGFMFENLCFGFRDESYNFCDCLDD